MSNILSTAQHLTISNNLSTVIPYTPFNTTTTTTSIDDFIWNAIDYPDEMNYDTFYPNVYCSILCVPCLLPFCTLMLAHAEDAVKSQQIKITNTELILTYTNYPCCYLFPQPSKTIIDLNNIWWITNNNKKLEIKELWGGIKITTLINGLKGLCHSSDIIKDKIINHRLKNIIQYKSYEIPFMKLMTTNETELIINPLSGIVEFPPYDIAFIDKLGFIERNSSCLKFWSPPVTRHRHQKGARSSFVLHFDDMDSSQEVKKVLDQSRDSFLDE